MLAAVLYGARDLRLEERPYPKPLGKGWVVVETVAVGICGTDKAFYTGSYRPPKLPLVPGHEAVGRVVEGPENLVGKTVVTEINLVTDWSHPICRLGLYTHCPPEARRVLGIDFDGAMAEAFLSRVEALHLVEGLSPEQAVFVEPLAAVLRAFSLEPLPPEASIAVVGAGTLAHLAAQVARLAGLHVYVVVRDDSPKKKFFTSLGLQVVTVNEAREVAKQLGQGFDAVFEATGTPHGLQLALELVKPLGTVYAKSTHGLPAAIDATRMVVNEVKIVGSRCGTWREFRKAIKLLREGRVKTVVTSVYRLEDAVEAFEKSLQRSELKVVVKP